MAAGLTITGQRDLHTQVCRVYTDVVENLGNFLPLTVNCGLQTRVGPRAASCWESTSSEAAVPTAGMLSSAASPFAAVQGSFEPCQALSPGRLQAGPSHRKHPRAPADMCCLPRRVCSRHAASPPCAAESSTRAGSELAMPVLNNNLPGSISWSQQLRDRPDGKHAFCCLPDRQGKAG